MILRSKASSIIKASPMQIFRSYTGTRSTATSSNSSSIHQVDTRAEGVTAQAEVAGTSRLKTCSIISFIALGTFRSRTTSCRMTIKTWDSTDTSLITSTTCNHTVVNIITADEVIEGVRCTSGKATTLDLIILNTHRTAGIVDIAEVVHHSEDEATTARTITTKGTIALTETGQVIQSNIMTEEVRITQVMEKWVDEAVVVEEATTLCQHEAATIATTIRAKKISTNHPWVGIKCSSPSSSIRRKIRTSKRELNLIINNTTAATHQIRTRQETNIRMTRTMCGSSRTGARCTISLMATRTYNTSRKTISRTTTGTSGTTKIRITTTGPCTTLQFRLIRSKITRISTSEEAATTISNSTKTHTEIRDRTTKTNKTGEGDAKHTRSSPPRTCSSQVSSTTKTKRKVCTTQSRCTTQTLPNTTSGADSIT